MTVRPAQAGDAGAIAALIGQLGYDATGEEVAARMPQVSGPGVHVLVAERAGAVIGCLTTSLMHVLHRPAAVGRISMMVVDAACRSEGVGALLVREAERLLARDGCYMVEVTSQLARQRAHSFYEQLGYEKTSVRLARTLD